MGLVYADLELISTEDLVLHRRGSLSEDKIKRMRMRAMVDSGAYMLVITDHIRQQLDLPLIQEQVFRLADDSEIRVRWLGRLKYISKTGRLPRELWFCPGRKSRCSVQFRWRISTW